MALPLLPLIGLGVSTLTSMGASIYNATREQPNIPGPTGAQKLSYALTQGRANQLASGQGLTETEYNRPLESAQRQTAQIAAQGMEATRSGSPFMSSIAAERIAKEFASKGSEIITETRKELTAMDIRAARENLKLSLQAQAQATEQANEIARVEREKKAQEEAWRNQKIQGIVNAAGQAAGSMLKLVELGEGMSGHSQDEAVASTAGVAGTSTTDNAAMNQVFNSNKLPSALDAAIDKVGTISGLPSPESEAAITKAGVGPSLMGITGGMPSNSSAALARGDMSWDVMKELHAGRTDFERWQDEVLGVMPDDFLSGF
jgi:hypothetical protein